MIRRRALVTVSLDSLPAFLGFHSGGERNVVVGADCPAGSSVIRLVVAQADEGYPELGEGDTLVHVARLNTLDAAALHERLREEARAELRLQLAARVGLALQEEEDRAGDNWDPWRRASRIACDIIRGGSPDDLADVLGQVK